MAYRTALGIQLIPLPAGVWTPVKLTHHPIGPVAIHNRSEESILMRSDPDDAYTEDVLPALSQEALLVAADAPDTCIIYACPSGDLSAEIILRYSK